MSVWRLLVPSLTCSSRLSLGDFSSVVRSIFVIIFNTICGGNNINFFIHMITYGGTDYNMILIFVKKRNVEGCGIVSGEEYIN